MLCTCVFNFSRVLYSCCSHLLSFSLPTCLLRVHVIKVILCVWAFYVNSKCKYTIILLFKPSFFYSTTVIRRSNWPSRMYVRLWNTHIATTTTGRSKVPWISFKPTLIFCLERGSWWRGSSNFQESVSWSL